MNLSWVDHLRSYIPYLYIIFLFSISLPDIPITPFTLKGVGYGSSTPAIDINPGKLMLAKAIL